MFEQPLLCLKCILSIQSIYVSRIHYSSIVLSVISLLCLFFLLSLFVLLHHSALLHHYQLHCYVICTSAYCTPTTHMVAPSSYAPSCIFALYRVVYLLVWSLVVTLVLGAPIYYRWRGISIWWTSSGHVIEWHLCAVL
jgi:hypothetical protein